MALRFANGYSARLFVAYGFFVGPTCHFPRRDPRVIGWWGTDPGRSALVYANDVNRQGPMWFYVAEAVDGAVWAGDLVTGIPNRAFNLCWGEAPTEPPCGFRDSTVGDSGNSSVTSRHFACDSAVGSTFGRTGVRDLRTVMQLRRLVVSSLTSVALLTGTVMAVPAAQASVTTVPRPDHVVMLILENHSSGDILGNPDAPYINSLAASGANMTSSFALTHPSQPNYIGLFSGSVNGVTDDSCPNTLSADNLGAQLTNSGQGFAGYAEDLPSVGYTGCTSGAYARKHSPWVNFTNVPASANRPLTQFPTDYSTLPAVSIVIPNLQHDMHDGSIAQGDAWVQAQLDGYVQWAKQHNSVFLLTFDEDDNTANNQIPTIIQGQNVQPGQYSEHIDHYNVLRTLQDAYGLAPIGNSATASPILDIWKPDVNAPQASFTATCVELTCSVDGSGSTAARARSPVGDGRGATAARQRSPREPAIPTRHRATSR